VGLKRHNSLMVDYDTEGLPRDWRRRVEDAVRAVGGLHYLYVTTVKAGERKNPPGVLVSVARDGSEESWTPKVELIIRKRIVDVLNYGKQEEIDRRKESLRAELGQLGVLAGRIPARETRVPADPAEHARRTAKRNVLTQEIAITLRKADIPGEARELLEVALQQMQHPDLWALWVRILMQVEETEEVLPAPLTARILQLL